MRLPHLVPPFPDNRRQKAEIPIRFWFAPDESAPDCGVAGQGARTDCLRSGGRLGTTAELNQDRTAIYHNGLPGAKSFLHQKQIGLRYVMGLADSTNRETLSHAFV